jgi:tetratricopeptide (TPR) repeat protein
MLMMVGCEKGLTFDEYMKKGEDYTSQSRNDKAIEAYKKAVRIKSSDANAHYALGCLYFKELVSMNHQQAFNAKEVEEQKEKRRKLTESMTQEYKQVLDIDPLNWNARYMIATELYNNHRYQEAIEEYKQVIKYNPKYSTAYGMLAESYLAIDNPAIAKENFDKEYQLDHDQENYLCSLGKAYYMAKDYNKGFEMLMRLKEMKSPYYNHLFDFKLAHNIP